jgi:hypothetical protein
MIIQMLNCIYSEFQIIYTAKYHIIIIVCSAFEVFRNIHSLVDDEEAIAMVACDVIKEFCDDNVKYLELRTTPKSNAETGN